MATPSAMRQALEGYKRPKAFNVQSTQALPEDMLDVLKLLSRDEEVLTHWQNLTGNTAQHLHEAASFYVQHILTHAGGSSFRQLALNPGAPPDLQRKHKRALLKWLHPDVNPSKWQTALFQRVVEAAEILEKAELPRAEPLASVQGNAPISNHPGKGVFTQRKTNVARSTVLNPLRSRTTLGATSSTRSTQDRLRARPVKRGAKLRHFFRAIGWKKIGFLVLAIFLAGLMASVFGFVAPIQYWVSL